MRFESWWVFILGSLVLLLLPWIWRWSRMPTLTFSLPIPKELTRRDFSRFFLLLRVLSFVFAVVALARPQQGVDQGKSETEGIDIVLVMDVSLSMNIEDLADRPRLDIAKETIQKFVRGRRDDRMGFVIFAGEPLTLAPPTLDYELLLASIEAAKTGELKDGTGIGDGLALGIARLKDSRAKSRVLVLLTDGENNVGQLDPGTAGEIAAGYGMKVYTIAIGREGRVRLPIRHQGLFGKTVTTYQDFDNQLNTQLLQEIADQTKGKFFRVTEGNALDKVFSEIDRLERSKIESKKKTLYRDLFDRPLVLALLLLALEGILRVLFWRTPW